MRKSGYKTVCPEMSCVNSAYKTLEINTPLSQLCQEDGMVDTFSFFIFPIFCSVVLVERIL